ncbi:MAG: hypothetical protein R3F43_31340 [bacterium]
MRAWIEDGVDPTHPMPPHRIDAVLDGLGIRPDADPASLSGASCGARPWPGRWWPSPTCCCWTSRPTTSTCPPSAGWRSSWRASGARC